MQQATTNIHHSARETARFNMIEQQIRTWDVLDPVVLQLLHDVPRENFVPESYTGLAFADLEIPIGHGQKMLSPKLEGRILQALSVQKSEKVLLVGTGSGYLTALLARLAKQVVSVEINPELSQLAAEKLELNKIDNVTLIVGDAVGGWQQEAPYDVMVFSASSPLEPEGIRTQLKVGGRIFIILGQGDVMSAKLIKRVSEQAYQEDAIFETVVAPLVNAKKSDTFHF